MKNDAAKISPEALMSRYYPPVLVEAGTPLTGKRIIAIEANSASYTIDAYTMYDDDEDLNTVIANDFHNIIDKSLTAKGMRFAGIVTSLSLSSGSVFAFIYND